MSRTHADTTRRVVRLACVLVLGAASPVQAFRWDPIPGEDLTLAAPRVERDAAAEVLLWTQTLVDSVVRVRLVSTADHRVRIKLFEARAIRDAATFEFRCGAADRLDALDVRTVLPDGRVLELPRGAGTDRVVTRPDGSRERVIAFAPAQPVPGAIVEYHVRLRHPDPFPHQREVSLQMHLPVRRLDVQVHPLEVPGLTLLYRAYQAADVEFIRGAGRSRGLTRHDIPASRDEPLGPPARLTRQWMLLYYSKGAAHEPGPYWDGVARAAHRVFLRASAPGRGVREAARAVTAGAVDDAGRLGRLLGWARAAVRDAAGDAARAAEAGEAWRANTAPDQTLKRGVGTARDLSLMVAAAARACGLDVRSAMLQPRTEGKADATFTDPYFYSASVLAVRLGERWVFVDPAARDLPTGMLPWDEEGASAIITGPDRAIFTSTPVSAPEASVIARTADLALDALGTLTGNVTVTLTGHCAARVRERDRNLTPGARLDAWTHWLASGIGSVEVTDVRIVPGAPGAPCVVRCRVRVAGAARRTGLRLSLEPSFFRRAEVPVLAAAERRLPVWFDHAWTERDSVRIRVPDLLRAEGDTETLRRDMTHGARVELIIEPVEEGRALVVTRTKVVGAQGDLEIPVERYARLHQLLGLLHERDQTTRWIEVRPQP